VEGRKVRTFKKRGGVSKMKIIKKGRKEEE